MEGQQNVAFSIGQKSAAQPPQAFAFRRDAVCPDFVERGTVQANRVGHLEGRSERLYVVGIPAEGVNRTRVKTNEGSLHLFTGNELFWGCNILVGQFPQLEPLGTNSGELLLLDTKGKRFRDDFTLEAFERVVDRWRFADAWFPAGLFRGAAICLRSVPCRRIFASGSTA